MTYDEDEDAALAEYKDALEQTKKLPAQRPRRKPAAYITRKSHRRFIGDLYAKWLEPIAGEIRKLQKRIAELEAAPRDSFAESLADAYQDVWSQGRQYERVHVVTWGGSLWLAKRKTKEKPGAGSADWKMIVKRGRDGKEVGKGK